MKTLFKFLALGLSALVLAVGYGLSATALSLHVSTITALIAGGLGIVFVILVFTSKRPVIAITVGFLPVIAALFWWSGVAPRNDRNWAPELAQTVQTDFEGSQATLHNVRDFTWISETEFEERWVSRTFDLDTLDSVDVALSYWGIDKIAHVLVSFGFADGEQIVFSVEIRKELGEAFSELGGLFKQFELSLIAATEQDILYLRTNARDPREDVYLYPLKVDAKARRDLFMSYARLGNQLAKEPRWYNTITANCSTAVYRLVRSFSPGRKFDPRFVLSGGLPEYFAEHDMLAWDAPLGDFRARAAISTKAQQIQPGQSYSEIIRAE
ncbi:DUF4105 domain-containing protein [Shimia sp.]|uniref:Lnb N-terminal periplasmic domain-containing protein n=1 Tax=Shimia sp. TaxID=1954381 RepID=UPI003298A49E